MIKQDKLYITIILFLILWLSLFPQPIQNRYQNLLRTILFFALIYLLIKLESIKNFFISKKEVFFWLYLGSLTLSYIFAVNRSVAIFQYQNMVITAVLVFFLIKNLVNTESFKWNLSYIICWLSLIVAVIGIFEFVFHKNILYEKFLFNPFYERSICFRQVTSTQMHPSVLGTYFLCCFPFSFFLIFAGKSVRDRLLGLGSAIANLLGIFILSFSRGAFLGAFTFLSFYLFKRNKKFYFILLTALSIFFIVALFSPRSSFLKRFDLTSPIHSYEIFYRLERIRTAIEMWKEYLLTGVGIDNFRSLFDKYHFQKDVPYEFKIPDNMYVTIFVETGTVGIFTFIVFILYLLKVGLVSFKKISDKISREFLFILICGFLGLLVNMGTYDFFYWYTSLYFFWIYAGSIRGLSIN